MRNSLKDKAAFIAVFLGFIIIGSTLSVAQTPPGANTIQHGEGINMPTITATDGYYLDTTEVTDTLEYPHKAASHEVWVTGANYYVRVTATGIVTSYATGHQALQAALDGAGAVDGLVVAKNGVYSTTVAVNVPENVTLCGSGYGTIISVTGDINGLTLATHSELCYLKIIETGSNQAGVYFTNKNSVKVHHVHVESFAAGIRARFSDYVEIYSCTLVNQDDYGIFNEGTDNTQIHDNRVIGTKDYGIFIQRSHVVSVSDNNVINPLPSAGGTAYCILAINHGTENCESISIIGNIISVSSSIDGLYAHGIVVSGESSATYETREITIIGNTVLGDSGAKVGNGVYVHGDGFEDRTTKQINVQGNVIRKMGNGIVVTNTQKSVVNGNTVYNASVGVWFENTNHSQASYNQVDDAAIGVNENVYSDYNLITLNNLVGCVVPYTVYGLNTIAKNNMGADDFDVEPVNTFEVTLDPHYQINTTFPANPGEGWMFYHLVNKALYYYNGTNWVSLTGTKSDAGPAPTSSNSTVLWYTTCDVGLSEWTVGGGWYGIEYSDSPYSTITHKENVNLDGTPRDYLKYKIDGPSVASDEFSTYKCRAETMRRGLLDQNGFYTVGVNATTDLWYSVRFYLPANFTLTYGTGSWGQGVSFVQLHDGEAAGGGLRSWINESPEDDWEIGAFHYVNGVWTWDRLATDIPIIRGELVTFTMHRVYASQADGGLFECWINSTQVVNDVGDYRVSASAATLGYVSAYMQVGLYCGLNQPIKEMWVDKAMVATSEAAIENFMNVTL